MTDRQFDTYQKSLLRELRRVKKELAEKAKGVESETLDALIRDTEEQLTRP